VQQHEKTARVLRAEPVGYALTRPFRCSACGGAAGILSFSGRRGADPWP